MREKIDTIVEAIRSDAASRSRSQELTRPSWDELTRKIALPSTQASNVTAGQTAATGPMKADRIRDTLALHGEAFVRAAYREVLGREADGSGLANYLTQLDRGRSKTTILLALRFSPEGRQQKRSFSPSIWLRASFNATLEIPLLGNVASVVLSPMLLPHMRSQIHALERELSRRR